MALRFEWDELKIIYYCNSLNFAAQLRSHDSAMDIDINREILLKLVCDHKMLVRFTSKTVRFQSLTQAQLNKNSGFCK